MSEETNTQIAKVLYLEYMSAMKQVLKLGEFKMGGRDAQEYRYFKSVVMDKFYIPMQTFFEALEAQGLLEKCSCGTSIRKGYQPCEKCHGAGFCNTKKFDDFLAQ